MSDERGQFCHHACPRCGAEWRHVISTTVSNSSFLDEYFAPCPNCAVSQAITMGTIKQLGHHLLESFLRLSPAEQAQVRKALYEDATGEPYRPESSAPKDGK